MFILNFKLKFSMKVRKVEFGGGEEYCYSFMKF